MRGKGLSNAIIDADPHKGDVPIRDVTPIDNTAEASFTAKVLNKFLKKSHEILKVHPLNIERQRNGEMPANYLLVRGAGKYSKVPGFKGTFWLFRVLYRGRWAL